MIVPGPSVTTGDDGAGSEGSSPDSRVKANASKHFGQAWSRASRVSGAPHFRHFAVALIFQSKQDLRLVASIDKVEAHGQPDFLAGTGGEALAKTLGGLAVGRAARRQDLPGPKPARHRILRLRTASRPTGDGGSGVVPAQP